MMENVNGSSDKETLADEIGSLIGSGGAYARLHWKTDFDEHDPPVPNEEALAALGISLEDIAAMEPFQRFKSGPQIDVPIQLVFFGYHEKGSVKVKGNSQIDDPRLVNIVEKDGRVKVLPPDGSEPEQKPRIGLVVETPIHPTVTERMLWVEVEKMIERLATGGTKMFLKTAYPEEYAKAISSDLGPSPERD